MAHKDVFDMAVGPYIPAVHEEYDLLPRCREEGREVFSYPAELDAVEDMLRAAEGIADSEEEGRKSLLIPHGKASYAAYLGELREYADGHRDDPELSEALEWLMDAIRRMNVKEEWSVVRYVGHEYDGDVPGLGLTRGRCYYWPCSRERPVYEGVIDDEEFTSYLYPCEPDSWEVVLDPTGMARRALAGEADTIEGWYPELAREEGTIYAEFASMGVMPKQSNKTAMLGDDGEGDGWGASEADPVTIPCPGCGREFEHHAWTLVNARRDPELASRLAEGTLFEFTCPHCGYTASLVQPCLYLDPEHSACVYLVVDERMADGVAGMFDDLAASDGPTGGPGVVRRIVFDRHDLRGRAIALEHGLDDRAIELLKVGLVGMAKQQGAIPMGDDSCTVNLVGVEDDALVFELDRGEDSMTAAMPSGGYELYAGAVARSSLVGEQPYYMNRAWAHHAIDVLDDEGVM